MITVGEIKKALTKLDGRTFPSREDLDNAIFPLFGPLIPHFQGMSFRDLADMLIEKGWVKKDKSLGGAILVQFPPEKAIEPEATPFDRPAGGTSHPITGSGLPGHGPQPPKVESIVTGAGEAGNKYKKNSSLSYREIALLVYLKSNTSTQLHFGFDSLIAKGLVEYVDSLEDRDHTNEIRVLKDEVISHLNDGNYSEATNLCDELDQIQSNLNNPNNFYRLSTAGKILLEDQPDSEVDFTSFVDSHNQD